jgi:hypothetical protein
MEKRQLLQKIQKQPGRRILLASLIILVALATLTSLVFALQHDHATKGANTIDLTPNSLVPYDVGDNSGRSTIFDRNFNELAVNSHTTAVYVRPLKLRNTREAAEKLAAILAIDEGRLLSRLKAEKGFVWIARQVAPHIAAQIADLKIKGVYLKDEIGRRYPNKSHGAHVIGFANSEQGLDGIEYYYDNLMHDGPIQEASLPERVTVGPDDSVGDQGVHLVLTLDLRVQKLLEGYLATAIKKSAALSGSAAIISPENGAVMALANYPTFDPNRFWDFSNQDLRNRFINEGIFSGNLKSFFQQAAQFEEIKSLTRTIVKQPTSEAKRKYGLLLVPNRQKRTVTDQELVVDSETLPALIKQIKSHAAVSIDLPRLDLNSIENTNAKAINGDRVTGLQLLADFCSMTNGHGPRPPHLLHKIWDRKSGRLLPANYPAVKKDVEPDAPTQKLLQLLGKKGPANTLCLESVVPLNNIGTIKKALTGPDTDPARAYPVNYQMLSLLTKKGHSLAMIIALNNVALSTIMKTSGKDSLPMSILDNDFVNRTVKWALAPSVEPTRAMLSRPLQLLPTKLKKSANHHPNGGSMANTSLADMPQVLGKSLRSGLQTLQPFNLRISVVGSGLIVAQQPNAGAAVRKGDQCILQLQSNH